MLNEERVILMTRMASYERSEGRENVKIGNYFRSDYIAAQVIKAVISAVIAFLLLFGLYLLYNFETLMQNLYEMDLIAFARDVSIYFFVFVAGYGILTYLICTWRYAKAKKSLKCYYNNLKKLNSLYNETR